MKGSWIIGGVLVLVAALGTAWYATRQIAPQPAVRSEPVKPASTQFLSLPARLEAAVVVNVPPPVEGALENVQVEVGSDIGEGQLLAQIRNEGDEGALQAATQDLDSVRSRVNDREATLAAARLEASRASAEESHARSELERASKDLSRQKILIAEGATPRQVYDKAQRTHDEAETEWKNMAAVDATASSRVKAAQSELDAVRKDLEAKSAELEHTSSRIAASTIVAPVTGVVSAIRAQVGDRVDPTLPDLFQIATDLTKMRAVAVADAKVLSTVKPGAEAGVIVAEMPSELIRGTVVSAQDGKLVVEFVSPSPAIRPGLTAQLRIEGKALR